MKRFYTDVSVISVDGGWRVMLDSRPVRTVGGAGQIVPSRALAESLAGEWRSQGETIDPRAFPLRDLADYAIDRIAPDPPATVTALLSFAETDTLCYRADPGEPLHQRQDEVWEPLLAAAETRHGIRFERLAGIMHRPQPAATLARLRSVLTALDPFTLAAAKTLASLAGSLTIALAALEEGAEPDALWAAANLEEDWQAAIWGWDSDALARRNRRQAEFALAMMLAALSRERG